MLPPTGAPLLKSSTGSTGPISPSRTPTHVRSAPSATVVEQEKPDTARANGDSTTSGQINGTITPTNAEESQLSTSRTSSEPPAPLGLRQRSSGAARVPSGHFSPMNDGATRPGSVGPDSSRGSGTQRSRNSLLPAPQIITDGSAPSIFDPTLEYTTEQVVLFWQPPSCFSQWSLSSFVVDDVSYSCVKQFMTAEKAHFSRTTAQRSSLSGGVLGIFLPLRL